MLQVTWSTRVETVYMSSVVYRARLLPALTFPHLLIRDDPERLLLSVLLSGSVLVHSYNLGVRTFVLN